MLNRLERGDHRQARGTQGGQQTSQQPHDDREDQPFRNKPRRDPELENNFAEGLEAEGAQGAAVHPKREQTAEHAAKMAPMDMAVARKCPSQRMGTAVLVCAE